MRYFSAISLAVTACCVSLASAAATEVDHDPDAVFAYQGEHVLTQDEIDASFDQIPARDRLIFIRDGNLVGLRAGTLLLNRILASEARKSGMDQNPVIKERLKLAMEQELALAWKQYVLAETPDADYGQIAREIYLGNPDEFMTEEIVDVSHILISTEDRSKEKAMHLASSLREQLIEAPGRFEELVEKYSEDRGKSASKGRFPEVRRGQMVKPFEQVAFGMKEPGEISEPVRTEFGYHIIRFNGRNEPKPVAYEQVKERLVSQARRDHRLRYRDNLMTNLTKEPVQYPEGALQIMVDRYFGQETETGPTGEDAETLE